MKNYKLTKTNHIYDFATVVENLSDETIYFTVDENNSDVEYDDYGAYLGGKVVYRECDKEDAEDYSDSFSIRPHDWAGLAYYEIVW